ncbi:hypothetical protein HELRODRAFT_179275 [Helobdella robusta]|uniref:Uncharacterized protein n=1 Tax=Helobdella robusta TaxID=6412 RepID=T1FEG8_HELRO|nr:hypothetical protein HELRODRAFT_179275 [Helobdella robusta]ESN95501.1 hypothetical protein HELRODRAFT_179275 [Helobdella robusta]
MVFACISNSPKNCVNSGHLTAGQENVAFWKMVNGSPSTDSYNGSLVVDGVSSFPFCYVSQTSGYQWIQIDLIWLYRVDTVRVLGKLERNVLMVNLKESYYKTNVSCSNLTSQVTSVSVTFQCPNATEHATRYISIDQSNSSDVNMTICEAVVEGHYAEVLAKRTNLLLFKNATMSSSYFGYNLITKSNYSLKADYLVDGNRDPNIYHGHCAHSNEQGFAQNWMQVDMQDDRYIDYVALISRDTFTASVSSRTSNFIIGLTDISALDAIPVRGRYPLCNRYPGNVPIASRVTLQCNANLPAYRYVILQQAIGAGNGYFAVCELEAYEPQEEMVLPHKQRIWTLAKSLKLLNNTFMEFSAVKPAFCVGQCIQLGEFGCDSFNFNYQLKICQLNSHRNGFPLVNLVSSRTWTFWNATYHYVGNL